MPPEHKPEDKADKPKEKLPREGSPENLKKQTISTDEQNAIKLALDKGVQKTTNTFTGEHQMSFGLVMDDGSTLVGDNSKGLKGKAPEPHRRMQNGHWTGVTDYQYPEKPPADQHKTEHKHETHTTHHDHPHLRPHEQHNHEQKHAHGHTDHHGDAKPKAHDAPHKAEKTDASKHPSGIDYSGETQVPNVKEKVPTPDLSKSHDLVTSQADHILAGETSKYNCHFYIATMILGHEPTSKIPGVGVDKEQFMFGTNFLANHGYKDAINTNPSEFAGKAGELKEGDVIVVKDPNSHTEMAHTAVVVRNKDGQLVIRQKFDPDHPVVDLTPDQFKRAYLYDSNERVEVWRK